MGPLLLVFALAASVTPQPWQPTGWLEQLRKATEAREHRPVVISLVSQRDIESRANEDERTRAVLQNSVMRSRIFSTGTMGYSFIPPRPQPVIVFVNTDRVESGFRALIAAHELGHVLLHSRGFLQVLVYPGTVEEPLITDAFNVVQDVLLERELVARQVNSQPMLSRQLRELARTLSLGGPGAVVPDSGHEQASHLATMVTRLLMTVDGMRSEKERVRRLLPPDVARLVDRYSAVLARSITTPEQYREAIYQACEANGVPRARVIFAPD